MHFVTSLFSMEYVYLGDRASSREFKGKTCSAVRRQDGKCIRGKNGSMLVAMDGRPVVVVARLLRKTTIAFGRST